MPDGLSTEEATKYFAGAKYFGLSELEVYSISFVWLMIYWNDMLKDTDTS